MLNNDLLNGFSIVDKKELLLVNGGKGDGGSSVGSYFC